MPEAPSHIEKARRNEDFYKALQAHAPLYTEWRIVALFYITLHYVDAALALDSSLPPAFRDPAEHRARFKAIARSHSLSAVRSAYGYLYSCSLNARYTNAHFPQHFLDNLEQICFIPLRRELRKVLNLPD